MTAGRTRLPDNTRSATPRRLTRRTFLRALAGTGILATGTLAYATLIEPRRLVLEHLSIPIPNLAAARHNTRLVQLSDFHAGRVDLSYLDRALHLALEQNPDFLLLTGDFVESGTPAIADDLAKILRPIAAHVETLGITGNHDFGKGHSPAFADRVCSALSAAGVRMLRNAIHHPRTGLGELAFVGMEDYWSGLARPATLNDAPPDASVILLAHNPDHYEDLDPFRFHLMLSGHTHGGQVRFPFIGPPILPVRHKERAAGLFHLNPAHPQRALYVNRGIGYLRRIRLFCPPEITCITLRNPALV
jgi:uncharacterized protein